MKQVHTGRWPDALHLVQIAAVTKHHGGRNGTTAQQVLRAVDVGQHAVQQIGALRDARFNVAPLGGRKQQRQWVNFPQTVGTLRVCVNVVRHAVLANFALHQRQGFADFQTLTRCHRPQESIPMRTRRAGRSQQLVVAVFRGGVTGE